jgi:OPA family sugar phosphate sensor protein UhpC-like MFS transporter
VLGMRGDGEPDPWRWCFYVGAAVLTVIWVQYYLFQRNRPEDVGLAPIDDPVTAVDESKLVEPPKTGFARLSRTAWTNVLLVGGFYFFIKFIRYAVWSWSAYFLRENYKLSDAAANVYATVFDILGIFGVLATGWLSDRYFGSRRSGVSLIMLLAMTATTVLLILYGDVSITAFVILLAAVGFTLYGPDALLTGAGAIDIGGRESATFATGIIAGFGAAGPVFQEVIIGRMYRKDDLDPVFVLLFVSAAMSTLFCAALVLRNRRGGKGV